MVTYVVGDIHGHLTALESLLESIPLTPDDRLIFLGDYVDKGPDVNGVLDLFSDLSTRPNTIFIRGNHDQMLLDARRDPSKLAIWEGLAGNDPLASYGQGDSRDLITQVPPQHWHFLQETCVDHFETERFIFVHGGIRPDRSPEEEDIERLHWTTLSMAQPHGSGKTVVCGHSAIESGRIADLGHTICIDTGISKGCFLTCLEIGSFAYWQATAAGEIHRGQLR